jgi:protocatechuate 3,4-dioxygenase beta subunit
MLERLRLTRRRFLGATVVSGIGLAACSDDDDDGAQGDATRASDESPRAGAPSAATAEGSPAASATQSLPPTPACGDDDDVTPEQTEGPFFSPNSPERTSLVDPGMAGTPLTVSGRVLSTDCAPVAGALLDFWQADDAGEYDNEGFTLRGHQFSGDNGTFRVETIVPGLYPGRTRHIHVKVQSRNGPVLTTQLYFPDEPRNATDTIFDPALVMDVGGDDARFQFVVVT